MRERRNVISGGYFFAGPQYLVAFKTGVPKTIQYRAFKQRICLCGGLKTPSSILYTPVSMGFEGKERALVYRLLADKIRPHSGQ